MGIDARIAFRGKAPKETWCIRNKKEIRASSGFLKELVPDATHEIDTGHRYYGPHYERGPWPLLAGILMELMQDPEIEKVWYGGDEFAEEMTPEKLMALTLHYLSNGHRPYHRPE